MLEYTDEFQPRPAKRLKMEEPKVELIPFQDEDDFDDDDFYNSPVKKDPVPQTSTSHMVEPTPPPALPSATLTPTIPGLTTEPVLHAEVPIDSIDEPVQVESRAAQHITEPACVENKAGHANVEDEPLPDAMDIEQKEIDQIVPAGSESNQQNPEVVDDSIIVKPELDAEFLQAAEVNKDNKDAEWRFDASDAESSESSESSDSSDDSSSSEDSDGDDVLLDPAEQVRILMKAMDEDGPSSAGPIRTANEKVEEFLPKPTLEITPDMKITELGDVQSVIDNYILITAKTSGEYMVLESGSVLCLQDRTVLGAVHETIGQVQSPIYMIGYNSIDEVKETGVAKGTKVFYVDDHSTYVFTKAIQAFKGTDASNIHDEEVADEEMEFSDDEQEADYKRRKKDAKKSRWEAKNGVAPSNNGLPQRPSGIAANSSQQTAYPTTIKYDDDDDEDMYKPLARPDNLHEMMAYGAPEERLPRSITNSRGRGRGDRQWADRGRGGRGRGGRGRGNTTGDNSQRPGQSDNARRGRGGHRGQDQRSPLPIRPEQSASPGQTSAFSFVPPLVNGIPPPPPIAMPFQYGHQAMPTFPNPPPIPGGFPPNTVQNGSTPNQFPPNFTQAFANFQQQFAQLSQQYNQSAPQSPQVQPPPQWPQSAIPPPVAPNAWAAMQTQQQAPQQMPHQVSPPNAQLENLLRLINTKPKE